MPLSGAASPGLVSVAEVSVAATAKIDGKSSGSVRHREAIRIEETSLTTESGKKTISKVELLEISEAPLDSSIFELPAGYRLALQTGNGGADLTKADTISNRVHYYWARVSLWGARFISLNHRRPG